MLAEWSIFLTYQGITFHTGWKWTLTARAGSEAGEVNQFQFQELRRKNDLCPSTAHQSSCFELLYFYIKKNILLCKVCWTHCSGSKFSYTEVSMNKQEYTERNREGIPYKSWTFSPKLLGYEFFFKTAHTMAKKKKKCFS